MADGKPTAQRISNEGHAREIYACSPIEPFWPQPALVHPIHGASADADDSTIFHTNVKPASIAGNSQLGLAMLEEGPNLPTQNTGTLDPFIRLRNYIVI